MAATLGVLLFAFPATEAGGQVGESREVLDLRYREAQSRYEAEIQLLEALSTQFDLASREFSAARVAGDEAAQNRAYQETLRISTQKTMAQRRVEEAVQNLREARENLLGAYAFYLDSLLTVAETTTNPVEQQTLARFVESAENMVSRLIAEEDPPVTLEPEPDLNAEPRDSPEQLRRKAAILEFHANQYEAQMAYNADRLERLRWEQSLLKRSNDFMADFRRFDESRPGVSSAAARTDPVTGQTIPPPGADTLGAEGPPLTLAQRIEALEALQEEIGQRILAVRGRAQLLIRLAGGEWA
jgi:hypothetical protein